MIFRIIQYSVFSDIKELDDQVFSGRQLPHGIPAGTTIILEVRLTEIRTTMPGLPKLPKFKGDNSQSLQIWIQELEAQLKAPGHEEERCRDLLLCTTEEKAFTFIMTKIGDSDGKISYAECNSKMLEHF